MLTRSLALAALAVAFGFGFAATSSVHAGSNHHRSSSQGSQTHGSSSQAVAKKTSKKKHRSTKGEDETKDYLVITLTDASRKAPSKNPKTRTVPHKASHKMH
jgi:hypothetical protein